MRIRTAFAAAALAVSARPTHAAAQSFIAAVSGDSSEVYTFRGNAVVCNYAESSFFVLQDSVSHKSLTFMFEPPPAADRVEYPIGEGDADVSAFFFPKGNNEVRGETSGKVTFTAGGPRGYAARFEMTIARPGGTGHVIVTGEFEARTLGYMGTSTRCDASIKAARVRAFGWPAAITRAVLAAEVNPGMTAEQASETWGEPREVERTRTAEGSTEIWHYLNAQLTLRNGRVVEIKE